jgi:hypothetical protein
MGGDAEEGASGNPVLPLRAVLGTDDLQAAESLLVGFLL